MNSISVRKIEFQSSEYADELKLRERVLRLPIGLHLSLADTEHDSTDKHICAFLSDPNGSETMVGCCLMRELSKTDVKMRQVAIDSNVQGQGLGSRLVGEFEKLARSRGYTQVFLDARESAIHFYLRLGYVVTSELFTQVSVPHKKMMKKLV